MAQNDDDDSIRTLIEKPLPKLYRVNGQRGFYQSPAVHVCSESSSASC